MVNTRGRVTSRKRSVAPGLSSLIARTIIRELLLQHIYINGVGDLYGTSPCINWERVAIAVLEALEKEHPGATLCSLEE